LATSAIAKDSVALKVIGGPLNKLTLLKYKDICKIL
jgi:hypothetical protein